MIGRIYHKLSPAVCTQNFAQNILMLNLNFAALNVSDIVIKHVFYICGGFLFPIRNGKFRGGVKYKTIYQFTATFLNLATWKKIHYQTTNICLFWWKIIPRPSRQRINSLTRLNIVEIYKYKFLSASSVKKTPPLNL